MADPEYALIRAIAEGDHQAFERLVKRYQNPLCNFVYRYVGDRGTAEDITQEVFMRVYRSASRFFPKARVSSWLFKIALNLSLNELKRRQRQRLDEMVVHDEQGYRSADAASLPATPGHASEEEIMATLDKLSGKQRAALLLRVNEGLSYREIGETLGLSVQSVEALIFRARRQLRASMRRKG